MIMMMMFAYMCMYVYMHVCEYMYVCVHARMRACVRACGPACGRVCVRGVHAQRHIDGDYPSLPTLFCSLYETTLPLRSLDGSRSWSCLFDIGRSGIEINGFTDDRRTDTELAVIAGSRFRCSDGDGVASSGRAAPLLIDASA